MPRAQPWAALRVGPEVGYPSWKQGFGGVTSQEICTRPQVSFLNPAVKIRCFLSI